MESGGLLQVGEEEQLRPGFYLLKDLFFAFDKRFNIRFFLSRRSSFLLDYKIGLEYFSQVLGSRCHFYNVDSRVLLVLMQMAGGYVTRKKVPANMEHMAWLLDVKKHMLPQDFPLEKVFGVENQLECVLYLLSSYFREGLLNKGTSIRVEGREIVPVNAATYAVCSVIWRLRGTFRSVIEFRSIYRKYFQQGQKNATVNSAPGGDKKEHEGATPGDPGAQDGAG